jgi:hypothetical protein
MASTSPILARLLLLALLGVDWAADVRHLAPAVKMLAHPLASTENFCNSTAHGKAVSEAALPSQQRCADSQPPCHSLAQPQSFLLVENLPLSTFPSSGLVYLILSIRR